MMDNGNHTEMALDNAMYDQYYADAGGDATAFDCGGDFDDCSAFAAADAFAIF
jgi:hypothetical protein